MASIDNEFWWDKEAELNGQRATVEAKTYVSDFERLICCRNVSNCTNLCHTIDCTSATVATGMQWHKVNYYVWTHPGNVDASAPQRTIVCWHGLARNAHDFDVLAQHLVKSIPNARVVAVDTPGRGKSDYLVNPAFYNLQTYAIVFMTIFNLIGAPESIEWVGVSMGGLLGMLLCAANIHCPIKKLVLIDVGPFVPAVAVARIGTYVGKDTKFENLDAAEKYFKSVYGQMGADITEEQWKWMSRFLTKPDGDKLQLHYDAGIAAAFIGAEPKDIDLWALWDLVKTPVMVYHGLTSDLLTTEIVEQMSARGPKVHKVVPFANVGHTPHLYHQKNCQEILDWFTQ